MDKAQLLVRMVARAFYDPECVVVIDALIRHTSLNYSDLAWLFQSSMKKKGDLSATLGMLKNGGLITEYTREETKQNAQKAVKVTYYFIDYRHAVDAIKYRLHTLGSNLRKLAGPAEEKKEYKCTRCKSEFKEIDVIGQPSSDGMTFVCLTCGYDLVYIEQDADDAEATGPVGVFNKGLGWLISNMQIIDKVTIPATSSEAAFAQREEPPRPKAQLNEHNQVIMPGQQVTKIKQDVKGMNVGPQKIAVNLATEEEMSEADKRAAADKKARDAAQNALPEWHTRSTVSNEITAIGQREEAARREREAEILLASGDADEKKDVKTDNLDEIFAQIEAEEKENQLKREREDEEEYEEDEDEDEFEDVAPAVSTPAAKGNGNGAPEAKRVKIEVDTPVSNVSVAGDGEEDEDEFEDV
jgi:transcription initiation factor TFIIE subunit alpha